MRRWRYRLFSMAGKMIHGGRQIKPLVPRKAPEAKLLLELYKRIKHLQQRFKDSILVT